MSPVFEDELQLLFNALESPGFRFILASHNRVSAYQRVRDALVGKYARERKFLEFSFLGKTTVEIRDAVLRMGKGIMLLRDVEYLLRDEHEDICVYFNQRRDFFAKYDIAFVFFIEPGSFLAISKKLPDWWSLRALELEFVEPADTKTLLPTKWDNIESSPYANWTQLERDQEVERLARLIADSDPNNLKLLGVLFADLGEAHHYSHHYDQALDAYEKSLAIQQQIGDRQGEGAILNNISQIYKVRGDYDTTLRYLELALAISEQIGDSGGQGATLNNLATTAFAKGEYDLALYYFEQALAIRQEIGDRRGEGVTLNNIGEIYRDKGDYTMALSYLERSLVIRQEIGDRRGEAATLDNIGKIHHAQGNYTMALGYLEQSLAIRQEIGDRAGEGTALNNISQIYYAKGDYNTALRYLEQSLAIWQETGDSMGLAAALNNMGAIYLNQENDIENATLAFWQSYNILEKLGSPNMQFPLQYLQDIRERIGEVRFQAIQAKSNPFAIKAGRDFGLGE